ncbi:MAG: hypothetical protein IIC73_06875, partial [Armatimonadetes bacterium]|nr:hypothetical protein [Armatimonadota bacterium]
QFRFYDLRRDRMEQTNLLDDGRYHNAETVSFLKQLLEDWQSAAGMSATQPIQSPEHIEALKSLGYVGDSDSDDGK